MTPNYATGSDGSSVRVDFASGRVALRNGGQEHVYAFAQITAAEVAEEGSALSRTNRGAQAARTLFGAVALGGTGALIGGLTASKTTQQRVSRVALNVTVQDQHRPLHVITFLDAGSRGADAATATAARRKADGMRAHLMNAIELAGKFPAEVARNAPLPAAKPMPVSPPPLKFDGPGKHKLVLRHLGQERARVGEVIAREVPEYSTDRRRDLLAHDFTPTLLLTGVTEARAQHVLEALKTVGAHASVKLVGFP